MSFRFVGRVLYQLSVRAAQGSRDPAAKCGGTAVGTRRFSNGVSRDAANRAAKSGVDTLRLKEESLRTVMFLSCWSPN